MHGLETLKQLNERVAHNRASNTLREAALRKRVTRQKPYTEKELRETPLRHEANKPQK